uniref:Uncharacterized protein n=1 Tax=Tetranychus urticae TaxID=32264 RepID=T1L0T0_TETUR
MQNWSTIHVDGACFSFAINSISTIGRSQVLATDC